MTDLLDRLRLLNLPTACYAMSVAALGHALQISSGTYNEDALWWVAVAFGLCVLGTLGHRLSGPLHRSGYWLLVALLGAGICWNVVQLLRNPRPGEAIVDDTSLVPFYAGVIAIGALVALGMAGWKATRRIWFPLALAVVTLLGVWMFRASPFPGIDVIFVHHEALEALLHHHDPYRISFPNIYGENWKLYYNPAVVFGDRIGFGFPYPPPTLLLALPGHVLFGDYRYAELAWLIGAAGIIGYGRRHLVAQLSAIMLLTTPRGFFVLEQGWTEPIAIFTLALSARLLAGGPLRASWATGLMLATKQYLPFTGLAVLRSLLLDRRRALRCIGIMALVGAAVTLPFALWHTNSFMRSVVWLQTLEPFRADALSFLIWADRNGYGRGTFLWAVVSAVVAAVLSLFTTRNTPAGFAASTAFTMFAMFVMGSKAFCNYYYFVMAAMCIAMASLPAPGEDDVTVR
ncbi:MAG: hypothetical protein JSU08_00675 [Acidobacteria bacterium]|nr:hypothetical protein [Acidobacteriota bacterium]